jgi:hypothetical protein
LEGTSVVIYQCLDVDARKGVSTMALLQITGELHDIRTLSSLW